MIEYLYPTYGLWKLNAECKTGHYFHKYINVKI